jgi:quinol monooxygenase YgiN
LSSRLYADLEDEGTLLFVEEWHDERGLVAHLRAEHARVLLSALDYAAGPPDVRVDTLGNPRGMEFIAACREAIQPAE